MRQAQKELFVHALILLAGIFCFTSAFAKNDPPYTSVLKGDSIKVGKSIVVQDTVFFNAALKPGILRTNAVSNIISLRLNEYAGIILPDSFALSVKIRLVYIDKNNLRDSVTERTLTINYNKFTSFKGRDIYALQNAYQMEVKILSVTAQYASLNKILPAVELENKLQIDRDYIMNPQAGANAAMNCSANAIKTISKDVTTIAEYGELKIAWQTNFTVDRYDVEWTWIDKTALDNGRYNSNGQLSPRLIFKKNATRITTASSSCMIPMLYDGEGTLFYRVRGVQQALDGELLTTTWSSEFMASGGLGRHDYDGHQRNLNWQASTSFAEEGKRKSVVQYFDGSLRNRQTVTRDNTTQTTVVAETFYDKQGRPVIQVLPAPSLSKLIAYTPGFNVADMNGSEYDKGIYDTLRTAADYCDKGADSLSAVNGTAQYYSPNNPKASEGIHQYIPDAKGYAFTETQYAQDNTGRINKQSGVGKDFQIGTGHETKYYYGTPEQTDLDALFGTEAGDASHYQKNMVRDANGQLSVSYVDMHGRTIATALAGNSAQGMQQLKSFRDSIQTESLLTPVNNILSGTTITASKSLLVSKSGVATFHYNLGAESLTLQDCKKNDICYDCLYDLTITITDDCNNQLLGGNPVVMKKSNFRLFEIDTTCNLAQPIDFEFAQHLEAGSYNITKVLSINQEGMRYYRDSLYTAHNTCKSYDEILAEQKEIVRKGMNCNSTPETHYTYESYRKAMLMDMIPISGIYGREAMVPDEEKPDLLVPNPCYSIFNNVENNYQSTRVKYKDEDGRDAMVMNDAGIAVSPQLLTKQEFIDNFQQSWAAELLTLHPEHETLVQYEKFSTSLKWDEDFANTLTYADAKAKGYLNPTGNTTKQPTIRFGTGNTDPLYALPNGASAKSSIEAALFSVQQINTTPLSAWGLATAMAKCPNTNPIDPACVLQWNAVGQPFNEANLCVGELDMAWKAFQTQYSTAKHNWLIDFCQRSAGTGNVAAACHPHFAKADYLLELEGLTGTAVDEAAIKAKSDKLYADNCKAYATRWWEQLQTPCSYSPEKDSAVIISYLVEVCKEGSDVEHMLGSSSVKPGSAYRFKSFEEVIKFYNDSTGRVTDINCNSYLMDKPLPYQQSKLLVRKELFTKPDTCECQKLIQYREEFVAQGSMYSNLSEYMLKRYQTAISQGALDSLTKLCSGEISCKYIPSPISLPTIFQCGINNACVPCKTVQSIYKQFTTTFPSQLPAREESDTVQQKTNQVFVNYMNSHLGFSKSHLEYLDFMDQCGPVQLDCESLDAIVNQFKAYYFKAGGRYGSQKITNAAYDMISGADALLKARHRNEGTTLPAGYAYAPYNNSFVSKLRSVSTYPSTNSIYHVTLPLNRDGAYSGFPLPNLDQNTVLPSDFITGIATNEELSSKYYAISLQDMGLAFRAVFSKYENTEVNSFLYYRASTPLAKYLPIASTPYNLDIHYYNFNFFRAGVSVQDGASYHNFYRDSVWVADNTAPNYPYAYQSSYVPLASIKGVKDLRFATEILPLENMANATYRPEGLKVTVELMNGSEEDVYLYSWEHPALNWKEFIDTSLYNGDCQKAFAYYYNKKNATGFTYQQLDSLYQKSCGMPLLVCSDDRIPSCDSLKLAVNQFKTIRTKIGSDKIAGNMIITEVSEELVRSFNALVEARQTPSAPQLTGNYCYVPVGGAENKFHSVIKNPLPPNVMFDSSFTVIAPLTLQHTLFGSQHLFPGLKSNIVLPNDFCAGTATTGELAAKYIGIPVKDYGNAFYLLWTHKNSPYYSGFNTYAPLAKYVPPYGVALENHGFNLRLIKLPASTTTMQQYVQIRTSLEGIQLRNIKKIKDLRFDTRFTQPTNEQVPNGDFSPVQLMVTAELLDGSLENYHFLGNYDATAYIQYKQTFDTAILDNDCEKAFTAYYNQVFKTNYTYPQIQSVYANCGQTLTACNNTPVTTGPLLCGKTESLNEPIEFVQADPCADSTNIAIMTATERYRKYKDSLANVFEEAYQQKCLNAINLESFTVKHQVSEYHYTLYYYDLAGNLVKTIAPEGVHPNRDQQWLAQVRQSRKAGQRLAPQHSLPTVYRYNSLNQVVSQQSPDGGFSEFWYDVLGRLVVSRNAKQKGQGKYSYTLYDKLGRITEVGQKPQATAMTKLLARDQKALDVWLNTINSKANNDRYRGEQVTQTVYDVIDPTTSLAAQVPVTQKSYTLRNRVSYTRTYDFLSVNAKGVVGNADLLKFQSATTYSYDIHGNVDTLLQQYAIGLMSEHGNNRYKRMAYQYDLISGKVNGVHYQPGERDQLYHRYVYDAENRITDVYTTDNKLLIGDVNLEEHDAHYEYYKHGPLARVVLGHQQVQGIDYAYTVQGWLKGVNSTGLSPELDMGTDGKPGTDHKQVAQDAYSFNLNYFTNEYSAISGKMAFPGHTAYMPGSENRNFYNGNISSMAVNIGKFATPQLYNYQYDQLNRLVSMDVYRGYNTTSNSWAAITPIQDYKERIAYDGNGNILTYLRNGATTTGKPLAMDNLEYVYKDAAGNTKNNQLQQVKDAVGSTNYTEDIDNQDANNYTYDAIGNLISDKAEKITAIEWSVYGKILSITKAATKDGEVEGIVYTYDASGNRISKEVSKRGTKVKDHTWYARDATGNVMAVYTYSGNNLTNGVLNLSEHHLYGSSRLGIWTRNMNMDAANGKAPVAGLLGPTITASFERGKKFFELSNHLGNVLVTVSDKKVGVDVDNNGAVDYYVADVVSASDYYPFGMQMPGRTFSVGSYRYGFNGKEIDNEISGIGNKLDFGARIYDSRLGRFLSVDPLQTKYPDLSPYVYGANNPIANIDKDGKYALFIHYMLTRYLLKEAGASEVQSNLIAHYASVFSDNPSSISKAKNITLKGSAIIVTNINGAQKDNPIFEKIGGKFAKNQAQDLNYDPRINYSNTVKSQSEDPEAQKWHATRTFVEKNSVSASDAINRSFTNAWNLLFKSASESMIGKMEINSTAIEYFGQALHTFQDIEAHRGSVFRSTFWNVGGAFSNNGNDHDLHNDSNPDQVRFGIALFFTKNAILVHQVMSGNLNRLTNGTQISIQGMNTDQVSQLKSKINSAGFEFNSNGSNTNMYSVTKKPAPSN